MIDWFVYWFMLPACILIASAAMLTGISGTAMLTPFLILVFPLINLMAAHEQRGLFISGDSTFGLTVLEYP